jgi:uncharacterized integral membrane protein
MRLMKKIFIALVVFALLLFALSFSVVNAHHVQLNYYIGQIDLPLSLLMIVSLIVGGLLGALIMMKSVISLRMQLARTRRTAKHSEKELNELKTLPLNDAST